MAHWAQIDENNKVTQVIVTDDNDPNGDEGYAFVTEAFGGRWVKTSYNSYGGVHYLPDENRDENGQRIPSGKPHLRYNYAGIGYDYDEVRDAFIPPKPTRGDWIFNENTCLWDMMQVD